jgi:hypothetical protein
MAKGVPCGRQTVKTLFRPDSAWGASFRQAAGVLRLDIAHALDSRESRGWELRPPNL